jgi:hypothetical protein
MDSRRLSACRICFHYLLHVAESIENCGPTWCYWQFPMERFCGMMLPLIHSKLNPYINLSKNVTLIEQLNHTQFVKNAKSWFQDNKKEKQWTINQVYGTSDYDYEEFYWPSCNYNLSDKEFRALKKFYSGNDIMVIFSYLLFKHSI